jgi:hypothetical protein
LGGGGGLHCGIHFSGIGKWKLGLHLACGGVKDVRKTARGAFDVGAIDVVGQFLHCDLPLIFSAVYPCGFVGKSVNNPKSFCINVRAWHELG